ncbi:UDP-N-acetylmuramyl-tripeptide synthetase [Spirochaetia bacterium]|nr:UDP-N-acetylmuramyl-tripeptide synthetase [Spirochaetia bacterium]
MSISSVHTRLLSDFFTSKTAEKAGFVAASGNNARGIGEGGAFTVPDKPLVTGLEYDSRKVKPGNLYFALPGIHTDGHRYIGDAIKRGASVIIHENELGDYKADVVYLRVKDSRFAMSPVAAAFYGFPSRRMTVIGVTGTEGKSTTVYLIWQLLGLMKKKAGFFSTVQYSLGDEEQRNSEHQTTPEAPAVQKLLFEMAENGAEYAVVEASSHGLSKRTNRLGDVDFDAAVMTNVTHEHLEFHGTWEQYRDDKANLFRALNRPRVQKGSAFLPSDSDCRIAVINADDPSAAFFAGTAKKKTLDFSVRGLDAAIGVTSIESNAYGNWYEICIRETGEIIDIRDKLPGAFNAGNVLAGLLVVSTLLGVPVRDIAPLVSCLRPVRGRMTAIENKLGIELLVDYAHTPSSFEAIFPPLRTRLNKSGGRIISLFGSAGERDTQKRPQQGRIAAKYSDIIILTDEDPRGENPMDILEEIAQGFEKNQDRETDPGFETTQWKREENLFLIPNRPAAIRKALSLARSGDLALLLGKGHENSIIYEGNTIDYDEIDEAEKALTELETP